MKTLTGITKIFLSIFSSWWRTAFLFFFILLMATFRTVMNRETRIAIHKDYHPSCVDRTIPNKIEKPNRVKKRGFFLNKDGKLTIVL